MAYEAERNANGARPISLRARWSDKLSVMRGPRESYSDVIIQPTAVGHEALNGS